MRLWGQTCLLAAQLVPGEGRWAMLSCFLTSFGSGFMYAPTASSSPLSPPSPPLSSPSLPLSPLLSPQPGQFSSGLVLLSNQIRPPLSPPQGGPPALLLHVNKQWNQ